MYTCLLKSLILTLFPLTFLWRMSNLMAPVSSMLDCSFPPCWISTVCLESWPLGLLALNPISHSLSLSVNWSIWKKLPAENSLDLAVKLCPQ